MFLVTIVEELGCNGISSYKGQKLVDYSGHDIVMSARIVKEEFQKLVEKPDGYEIVLTIKQ